MKIYLIPGLGYDCRIFEKLNFKNSKVECLNWIEPKGNEAIQAYTKRMFKDVLIDKSKVVLIGHSMGGVVAQEVAAMRTVQKIILISSIKSRAELPLNIKSVAPLGIYKFFTKELSIGTVKFWGEKHGLETEGEQDLFKSMVGQQTNSYLQWALKTLSQWESPVLPKETTLFHIHGTNDKTLPFSLVNKPDVVISEGSHMMVYKRHEEISKIILKQIEDEFHKS